jgi:hypothetical protein
MDMKTKLERFGLGLILAPILPLAGFMAGWGMGYSLLPEKWIPYPTLGGLLAGILADVILLKRLLDRRPGWPFWISVFLFYSVGIFGMFMGVPVINAALAIPAGFVVGSRLADEVADQQHVRTASRRTAWFTTGVLALICISSAILALSSPSTASDLHGMLKLGFEVTQGMIIGLILVGGFALLVTGWVLSVASVRLTHFFLQHKA